MFRSLAISTMRSCKCRECRGFGGYGSLIQPYLTFQEQNFGRGEEAGAGEALAEAAGDGEGGVVVDAEKSLVVLLAQARRDARDGPNPRETDLPSVRMS